MFCSNIGDECPCHVSLQIQSDCILADKFCAHFLSFFLFLSLEIFYSSMRLLQRCIADSVCVSVTIFFSGIPIMAMKEELDPVFPILSIPVSSCALFIEI